MSDEQLRPDADERESADDGAAGDLEPGGGPRRVVSERSVDDILASLDETTADLSSESGTATVASSARTDVFEDGEDDPSQATETALKTTRSTKTDESSESDRRRANDRSDESDATTSGTTAASRPADADSDDPSIDDLAARLNRGAVSGADVRAAETGEGRESTPDIGDVDLSMDDLERATETESTSESTPRAPSGSDGGRDESDPNPAGDIGAGSVLDDAGPLGGSVDFESTASIDGSSDSPDASDSSGEDEPTGVLARLKRLVPW